MKVLRGGHSITFAGLFALIGILDGAPNAYGTQIRDDFSDGAADWIPLALEWNTIQTEPGAFVYRGDLPDDTLTQKTNIVLDTSWYLDIDLQFQDYYGENNRQGQAGFGLFPSLNSPVLVEASLDQNTDGTIRISVGWFDTTNRSWQIISDSGWFSEPDRSYHLQLARQPDSERLQFAVLAANGSSFRFETEPIPLSLLNSLQVLGLHVHSAKTDFSTLVITTPATFPVAPFIAAQPRSQTISTGSIATFSVAATGTAPLLYQWYRGTSGETNGIIPGATDTSYATSSLSTNASFWVSVSNSSGAADSDTASVTVLPPNSAHLSLSLLSGLPALRIDGFVGITYRVEYKTSLNVTNWIVVTNFSQPTSPFTFLDSDAVGFPSKFYHLVAP